MEGSNVCLYGRCAVDLICLFLEVLKREATAAGGFFLVEEEDFGFLVEVEEVAAEGGLVAEEEAGGSGDFNLALLPAAEAAATAVVGGFG